jgi:tetratricopeptide (TPR) repeat protein
MATTAQPTVVETPPPRAQADFDRAVGLMRAGSEAAAEAQLQQLAAAYPSFAGPDINLGILYRKDGRLDKSAEALKSATARNNTSAVAWNELGVTLRMRGEFAEAASAYERAIGADANFAPAHRNLGVVLDLYLGDPERALSELERYQELSGEEKPVSVWIAELRQRTGKKKPAAAPAPAATGDSHG